MSPGPTQILSCSCGDKILLISNIVSCPDHILNLIFLLHERKANFAQLSHSSIFITYIVSFPVHTRKPGNEAISCHTISTGHCRMTSCNYLAFMFIMFKEVTFTKQCISSSCITETLNYLPISHTHTHCKVCYEYN